MLIAFYTGNHQGDGWPSRIGLAATRLVQKGPYGYITHCEAIHARHADGSTTIASASLRDGGVRSKTCVLQAGNWLIVDVPQWDVAQSIALFEETEGEPYDWRGAWAAVMPGHQSSNRWFCNEAVAASAGVKEPHTFTPAVFSALCFTFGRDVTQEFFNNTTT